jgi:predicted dehydrogenase
VAETDGCRLAAVADLSAANLERAGRRHPSATLYSNWQNLVADTGVDAVMIATPVATHFEIALAALMAGKHVLVEKPITTTSVEAARLIEEAATRKLVLMVDHTFVYTSAVRKIRDLIVDGSLGDIYYYDSTRINLGLFQHDVNVIWDLAVHDLAILDYLMDEQPVAVSASGAGHIRGSPENMAHISLFFPSGTVAHLNVNWLAPVKIRQTLIGGSRRMIVYNDLEPSEKVKVYDRGVDLENGPEELRKLLVSYRIGDMWAPQLSVKEALLTETEHFVSSIATGSAPITSGTSGLNVVAMLECAARSVSQRGAPVEINPVRRAS